MCGVGVGVELLVDAEDRVARGHLDGGEQRHEVVPWRSRVDAAPVVRRLQAACSLPVARCRVTTRSGFYASIHEHSRFNRRCSRGCRSPRRRRQARASSSAFPTRRSSCSSRIRRPATSREAIDEAGRGLERRPGVPDAARRDRLRQDLHDGQRHRAAGPAGAGARAQQDAGGAALLASSASSSRTTRSSTSSRYYDYYQPEAYVPSRDLYIEKDSSINEHIEQMRLSATKALLERPRLRSSWPRCRRSTASATRASTTA